MDLFRRQASGVFPGMWASRTNIIPSNYYIKSTWKEETHWTIVK